MFIELDNIQKSFADGDGGSRKVLDGLNLKVEQGELVAVTGVSGTGKTTLLNILGTLLPPDAGTYQLEGERISYNDKKRLLILRNQQIGFMFQDFRLLPQLTAWQNILLPLMARKHQSNDIIPWAEQLTQKMGINGIMHQLPETLSGGEKSRVALCRSLIMRPKLLLADEPTGQLDSHHANEVAQLLKNINEKLGTTIVLVTHSEELAHIANEHYILKDGKL